MATGKRLQGSGYGEHGLVLEAGVQHFGRKLRSHFGESGTGEGASWQKDRPERLSVVSRLTTAWAGAAKFYSAARYKGVARFDAKAADLDAGGSLGTESSSNRDSSMINTTGAGPAELASVEASCRIMRKLISAWG